MGIFRRGPKPGRGDAQPDPEFGFLTADEGLQLREHVRAAFATHGVQVTVLSDHAVDGAGRKFGLGNLAAVCHSYAKDGPGIQVWPELTRDLIGGLLRATSGPSPFDTMSTEEIRSGLYLRIAETGMLLPDPGSFAYARPVAPGLHEVIALDLPETVVLLPDAEVAKLGPVDDVRARAMDNLRRLPIEGHEVVQDGKGLRFDSTFGESFFTASRAVFLDDLVRQVTGHELGSDGALVAMPSRHELWFHPIEDSNLIPTLHGMAGLAARGYDEAVGPLSPYVYWWRQGTLTQISARSDDGGLRINVEGDLHDVLNRLAEVRPNAS